MAAITSANVANAIVKLVAADALPVLVGNLVMGNLVDRDYEPALAHAGDTINVPIPPVMVANNILEGGTVQTQNPNLGNAQIVLNTHAEATFQIPDVTKALAVPDLLKIYMQPAVAAIAQKVESDLLNLYAGFTANTPVGTPGTAITEAVIDAAETALFLSKVPPSAAEVHRGGRGDLFGMATDSAVQRISDRGRRRVAGADGRHHREDQGLLRVPFAVRAETTGQQPGDDTHNLAFTRDAIGLVIRRLPQPLPGTGAIAEYAEMGNFGMRVVMSYQPNTLAQQFTVDILYGCGILRNTSGVQVNT